MKINEFLLPKLIKEKFLCAHNHMGFSGRYKSFSLETSLNNFELNFHLEIVIISFVPEIIAIFLKDRLILIKIY